MSQGTLFETNEELDLSQITRRLLKLFQDDKRLTWCFGFMNNEDFILLLEALI